MITNASPDLADKASEGTVTPTESKLTPKRVKERIKLGDILKDRDNVYG